MLIFVFLFSKMIFLLQSSEWQWRLKNMNGDRARVNDSWAHTELNISKRWLLSKQLARTEQSREQKLWMMNAGWVNGEHTLSTRWIDTEQTVRKHKKGTRTVSRNIEIECWNWTLNIEHWTLKLNTLSVKNIKYVHLSTIHTCIMNIYT